MYGMDGQLQRIFIALPEFIRVDTHHEPGLSILRIPLKPATHST